MFAVWSLVGNQALFAGREAIAARSGARRDDAAGAGLLFWSHEPDIVLGDAAAGLGDREVRFGAYRDAVDTDPRNWVAWLRLAQVARGAERNAAYDRVRELNPLVEEGSRASDVPTSRLALALLAPPEDEPAGDERAADGDDAEERKTGVRKRLGLRGGRAVSPPAVAET